MKKGDLKKQEILNTAEQLFCKKGYEQTSIQDILDILGSSKGSFYHHYASKDSLLSAMCAQRAERMAAQTRSSLTEKIGVMERINLIFSGMMPLSGERLSFLLMLLPVFGLPEGWSVKQAYRAALLEGFQPLLADELVSGREQEQLFCDRPEAVAAICLGLANDVWCGLVEEVLKAEKEKKPASPAAMLEWISPYRTAVEKLIDAPFGSVELMNLMDMKLLSEQIHVHWR